MPDNRELATAILLAAFVVLVLVVPDARRAVPGVVRAVLAPKLLIVWVLYGAYSAAVVAAARAVGLWSSSMWWATCVVVLTVGLPLLFHAVSAAGGSPAAHTVRTVFGGAAIAGAYVNLASFSLAIELVLQLVGTVLTAVRVYAAARVEYAPVRRLCDVVLAGVGVALLWKTTAALAAGMPQAAWVELGLTVAMTLWFPLALLPFLYPLAYVTSTEAASTIVYVLQRPRRRSKAQWFLTLLLGFRFRLGDVQGFGGEWARELALTESRGERRGTLDRYRRSR